jgi:acylphosphatase
MEHIQTLSVQLYGVVQGVGMRYFIYRNARRYGVNGYVKNMFDGSVKCIFQAKEDVLEVLLKHIKKESPGIIDNIEKEIIVDAKEYQTFNITF